MATAFINLNPEGKSPIRVRLDQIAAVEPSATRAVRVTTLSGAVILGYRPLDEVWEAMREAAQWLEDGA